MLWFSLVAAIVPLTIILFRANNQEKFILPVLTFENIAAIRGSLLMPFGSPQNLFLYAKSGISTLNFILMMLPLWIFSAILLLFFIFILFRKENSILNAELKTQETTEASPKTKCSFRSLCLKGKKCQSA